MKKLFNKNIDEVYNNCIRILKSANFTIEYKDKAKYIIEASSKVSFLSWGENIIIRLEQNGNHTFVNVISTSKAQMIDWGTNSKNERMIIRKLNSVLK
jgi:hypothetical protein